MKWAPTFRVKMSSNDWFSMTSTKIREKRGAYPSG
jgi:hypothetical protein